MDSANPPPAETRSPLRVSKDRMFVFARLDGEIPPWENVLEKAGEFGIVCDLDEAAFRGAVESPPADPPLSEVKIGRGDPGTPGIKDACRLDPDLEARLSQGITCVAADAELGTLIPGRAGLPGQDVFGASVDPPEPEPSSEGLNLGFNIVANGSAGTVQATVNGVVHLNGNDCHVVDTYVIPGDLEAAMGEIVLNCSLRVKGTIRSAAQVTVEGAIEVLEHIEDATVRADGDVTVKKGIYHRERGSITSLGTVRCHHADNAMVTAGRDIVIESEGMHCRLTAMRSIRVVEDKGVLIGGVIAAGQDIEANILGSEANVPMQVKVGFDHSPVAEVLTTIRECENMIDEIEQMLDPSGVGYLTLKMTDRGTETIKQLAIARGELAARILRERRVADRWLRCHEDAPAPPYVRVVQTAYRKVDIRVNTLKLMVETPLHGVEMRPSPENLEVVVKHL